MNEHKQIDIELKHLETITKLKNKLTTFSNNLDYYNMIKLYPTENNEDDIILKKRILIKAKKIIRKYLKELRTDENFIIKKIDRSSISLNYFGKYVTCKRVMLF